jgi:hypothetical protein
MAADPLKIIDLHAPDLPGNDRDIYKAMLERMLGESEESGVEAPESAEDQWMVAPGCDE